VFCLVWLVVVQDACGWAAAQFGAVELGDRRRTDRAVTMAAAMARAPAASLPRQMGGCHEAKAAYRLLASAPVTHEALTRPHRQATRAAAAAAAGPVLFVQDTTTLDYSGHTATVGLGPTGDGRGRGLLLHSTLALAPDGTGGPPRLLGLAAQRVWARPPSGRKARESQAERQRRPRESQRWSASLSAVGTPPGGACWVDVSDAEGDVFLHLREAQCVGYACLVRAGQNRRVDGPDGPGTLFAVLRAQPAQGHRTVRLGGRGGAGPAREAVLAVAWAPLTLRPPKNNPAAQAAAPLAVWGVRAWNAEEDLEWVLLSTLPVTSAAEAMERLDWYAARWLIEEYHKALKTGCAVEQRRLGDAAGLSALLGFLAPLAIRLLDLRETARRAPETAAEAAVPAPLLVALARLRGRPLPTPLTVHGFWRETAKLGGFLGRKSDGEPGWQTLWRGFLRLLDAAQVLDPQPLTRIIHQV
jgi:hypothetical protein